MFIIFLLFLFTTINEAFVVIYTHSIQQRNKLVTALVSALMEPIRLVSVIYVVENEYKWLSVISVSAGCAFGSFLTLLWLNRKKEKKRLERKLKRSLKNKIEKEDEKIDYL